MKSLDIANSLYLIFNNVDGYIECSSTEESNEDKYLIFASRDKKKEVFKKCTELWDKIKNHVETKSGGNSIKYWRDFMKISFETDDGLSLGEILNIPVCIIAVGSVFHEDNNYYSQAHLRQCLYEFGNEL